MNSRVMSKVLVLDECSCHQRKIKSYCEANGLVGLKVRRPYLMSVLATNIDLGAILLSETYGGTSEESAAIARRIHGLRPELPIILRREASASSVSSRDLSDEWGDAICATYAGDDFVALNAAIDEYLFSQVYPNALVRGISEITEGVLASLFSRFCVSAGTPYLVRDPIIFGEVFSLIPLESNWCRGYMMLQTEEHPLLELTGGAHYAEGVSNFRAVNGLLGEMTNLIWGAFKNRYVGDAARHERSGVEVPLLINHEHRYISFGTNNPQLCFIYTLTDAMNGRKFRVYQRFVFNLYWSPEDFREVEQMSGELVASGELELF